MKLYRHFLSMSIILDENYLKLYKKRQTNMNKFSQNLRFLRESEKLKQTELAEKIGITQRKVSYLENGTVEPNLTDLCNIADFFEISIDELVGRKNI